MVVDENNSNNKSKQKKKEKKKEFMRDSELYKNGWNSLFFLEKFEILKKKTKKKQKKNKKQGIFLNKFFYCTI